MFLITISFAAYSWSEPTTPMPNGYTKPINTSNEGQTKDGELKLNGSFYSPIFYDKDDSKYYINPSGNSVVSGTISAANPTGNGHAATKGYVDEQIAAVRAIISGAQPLVNGVHTWNECESAGGTVVDSDVELKQCRFNTSSCPSGWNQYKNFSTTLQQTFTRYESYHQCTASCAVSGHAWGNVARECCSLRTCWTGSSGCSGCSHCGSCWNGYDSACDYSQHLAQISQIGCY